ncbi:di-trans,poly-cis-decaprenylcistransferase [Candidatus Saccharibacteria bacterium CG2_30_41_52]|nr:di-trans,poly-cis-decaprenylcistransferase [Candidatus Saccharibacteria bacterium]OIP85749.1 MAG: di-trans,poly-cis-decaprenylcistransferase [Candidatus Saccharibacteria bacterium CG2_30_41_52]PIZ61220.1 MAG: di-trans,poly-cis-decaprenylcistransferase [Candidatus Saccharibacteria bacterium CG_4_10_14_0_2_um_filter_41_11]
MSDLIIPKHIGFIVDGNRRWAKQHGLPTYEGHLAGYNTVQEIVTATFEAGVEFVTCYIFSTENWKRSEDEVSKLMGLILRLLTSDLPIFEKNNIRLRVIGSRDKVSDKILAAIDNAESVTAHNNAGTLAICFNYGGQLEIVDAVKKIIQSGVSAGDVTRELISRNIYAPEIPSVDIVVRTSGEQRLSNFMLWRAAYSEMLFIPKMWPDMSSDDVTEIIEEFSNRSRRFGS